MVNNVPLKRTEEASAGLGSHLDASILEDGHLPEASLSDQSALQQLDQPTALGGSWVFHRHHSTGQAAPRAHTPDRGGGGKARDKR